jgi:hypothetical protein
VAVLGAGRVSTMVGLRMPRKLDSLRYAFRISRFE